MDIDYLRTLVKPIEVAEHFLGSPCFSRGNNVWYYSPFRNKEKTPSFCVNDLKGFRDFGTGEQFDCFSFIERLYAMNFIEASKLLGNFYGVSDNDYISSRMVSYLKMQREANQRYVDKVNKWYYKMFDLVEKFYDAHTRMIKGMNINSKWLPTIINRQDYILQLREKLLATDSFKERESLMKQVTKEGIPKWMEAIMKE